MDFDTLGATMKAMRVAAGLSRMELCRKSGLAPATITRLEAGKLDCRWSTLVMYARACGMELGLDRSRLTTDA